MKTTARPAVAMLGAALALSLAACSGNTEGATERVGPLDEYFEDLYADWTPESGDAQMRQMEELVAQCMSEEGFEYIPVDHSGGQSFSSDDLDVEWGTREFAELYGYGATTDPWSDLMEEVPEDGGDQWFDPNEEYVSSMSESEQEAYYLALYGDQTGPAEGEEEEWEWDWEQAGCQGWAQNEAWGGGDSDDGEQFRALQDDMNAMWEATMSDPRIAAVEAEWASCMADAGYTGLAAVGDAEQAFYDELNSLWEDAYADIPPDADEEAWMAVEESIEDTRNEMTAREIETAMADYDCRDEVDYTTVQQDVNFEYQQEFVDTHGDELEAYIEHLRSTMG